jgi:hypothetical protein
LAEFFQERDENLSGVQCLITPSGRCIMDMIRAGHGKPQPPGAEVYTPRHLQLLRLAGYLIQSGDARLLDALEVLLAALLSTDRSHLDRLPSTLPRPTPEPPRRPD